MKKKVVVAAVIKREGRILVTRRGPGQSLEGFWEFPGGKVEPGESLSACLERELREELEIVCRVGEVVAESLYDYPNGRIHLVAMDAEILSGTMKLTVHDELDWIRPECLISIRLAPADIPIAEHLAKVSQLSEEPQRSNGK